MYKKQHREPTYNIARLSQVAPPSAYLVTFGGLVRPMPWGADLLVPRASKDTEFTRLVDAGARPAGSLAFEALRVELLRPRLGVDTDDRTIPHEARWIGTAVHLDKGCYRGQETVSKVENVGRPPRRLLLLHLDGSLDALPETGDPVLLDGKVVGRVGSAVRHHELGSIALALIKRSVPLDAVLAVGPAEEPIAASIDPDSVPPDNAALGRQAVRNLGK
jgi:folate-binding protein YgfZ